MRDYQPTKSNENWIEHNKYMQTLYFIRSYFEMKEEYNSIIEESSTASGPKGSMPGDPTATKAARIEKLHDDIRLIEEALKLVPEDYRKIVWDNVVHRSTYKGYASERTIRAWKGRFIRKVAIDKGIV